MIFPQSNLPIDAQPWAREITKQLSSLIDQVSSNEVNNAARDNQLNSSIIAASAAATRAENAVQGLIDLGNSGSEYTINADNLTAGTITGLTFQTDTTGARIVIDGVSNALFFYDASNNAIGTINTVGYTNSFEINGPSAEESLILNPAEGVLNGGGAAVTVNATSASLTGPTLTDNSLVLASDGVGIYFQSTSSYNRTYTDATNARITVNGVIGRSTSSARYKLLIEEKTNYDFEKILQLKPKTWFDKSAAESQAQYLSELAEGKTPKELIDNLPLERISGLIAEDLVQVGLEDYVSWGPYDENGNRLVEGINYTTLWTCLIPIVKNQKEQINSLTERITELEGRLNG